MANIPHENKTNQEVFDFMFPEGIEMENWLEMEIYSLKP